MCAETPVVNATSPLVLLALARPRPPAGDDPKPKPIRVLIQTDKGDIEVELDAAKAPNTVGQLPQVRRWQVLRRRHDSTAPSPRRTSPTTR